MQISSNNCNNITTSFIGNLIPQAWYKTFLTESGRPDTSLISILSEIYYWHRPSKEGLSKFKSDAWQTSYDHFINKFCFSRETIRRAFVKLEELGVACRELRLVKSYGQKYNNVLFVHLDSEKLSALTGMNHFKSYATKPVVTGIKLDDDAALELKVCDSGEKNICAASLKMCTPSPQIVRDHIEEENNKNITYRSDKNISDFIENKISESDVSKQPLKSKAETAACFSDKTSEKQEVFDKHEGSVPKFEFLKETKQSLIINPKNLENTVKYDDQRTSTEDGSKNQHTSKALFKALLSRKPLIFFYPLTEMDAIYLRKASGRPFSLSFINKLLLKLSGQYPSHGFYKKTLLLSYLAKALTGEKYDAEAASKETFKFKPKEGTPGHKTNMQSNYLKTIEQSRQTDPVTKIKQKIIGLSAGDAEYAYYLITNTSLPHIQGTSKESSIAIKVSSDITIDQKKIITKAVKEVMGMQTFITFKDKENKQNGCITTPCTETPDTEPELSSSSAPSSPLWQKIRSILKQRFGDKGEAIDKTWFAKLDIELKAEANTDTNQIKQILIKCPGLFVKDWIKTNYDHEIESAVADLALTAKETSTRLDRENQISQESESETTILQPETLLPFALNPDSIKNLRFEYVAY